MDDSTFRDELVTFSLQSDGAGGDGSSSLGALSSLTPSSGVTTAAAAAAAPSIDPLHRPRLLPVVIRLVYGRLAASGSRGRAGGHGGPQARRAAVLAFLSGLCSEELSELFTLMVRAFVAPVEGAALESIVERADEGPAEWEDAGGDEVEHVGEGQEEARGGVLERVAGVTSGHLGNVSASRQAGFLKMVKEVARQLGQRALPYVDRLLALVLALLEHSNAVSESERCARSGGGGDEPGAVEDAGQADGDLEAMQEEEDEDEIEEDDQRLVAGRTTSGAPACTAPVVASTKGRIAPGALRALCLRALCELLSQFSASFDFVACQGSLWPALADPIARLPASTVGAVRSPALLVLAETITESEALIPMLSPAASGTTGGGDALIPAVLDCISAGSNSGRVAGPAVLGSSLTFVERLLRYDGGALLRPHLNHLISNFAARLSVSGTSGKGQDGSGGGGGGLDSHTERGLAILAHIAEMAASGPVGADGGAAEAGVDAASMSKLVSLLVPSLQPDRRASDEAKSAILRTVSALARRVDSAGARRAWPLLSRLLGPAGARPSGMAAAGPRGELVGALEALAGRPDLAASAGPAVFLVAELNARDAMALDEPDFGRAVPAYNSLSEGTGWEDVIVAGGDRSESAAATAMAEEGVTVAAPLGGLLAAAAVAQHCFHGMHDQEVALRGAAGAALKRLVRDVAARERASAVGRSARAAGAAAGAETRDERCPWEGLMRTVLMPGLRAGMACRTETVRKGYISLLRETVSAYQAQDGGSHGDEEGSGARAEITGGSSSVIPTDLWILARADDPESDFFLNACHMQVHRRARALAKARKAIEDGEEAAAAAAAAAAAGTAAATVATASSPTAMDVVAEQGGEERQAPTTPACPFRVSTLVHFLLPLALHPLHEAAKSAEAGLLGQAVLLAGAVARHLPWTHYNAALRGLMQQVGGSGGSGGGGGGGGGGRGGGSESDSSPEKERAMVSAMCQVLDGFHFALIPPTTTTTTETSTPSGGAVSKSAAGGGARSGNVETAAAAAAGGDAVWRAVNGRLLGSLRALLTKEVRGKSGGKEKVLRAPVALGMLNLVRRLPAAVFAMQLQPLLMTVCQSLKSRDSNARDTARDTLTKMARALGPEYLQQVGGWVGWGGECVTL